MAAAQVKCPSCGTLLQIAALPPAGGGIKCPRCGQVFRIAGPAPANPPAAKAAPPAAPAPKPAKASPAAPPARPIKAAAAVPPPTAAKPNAKAAPRPAPAQQPVAKPVAKPVARPVKEDDKPARRRPAAEDEFDVELVGRRRSVDEDDHDDEDDAPRRRGRPRKSSGKMLLVVGVAVLLVGGAAIGGTVWVVKSLFGGKSDNVAATGKEGEHGDAQAGNGLDVRFVAPDFFAGAVVNVPRVLKAPVVASALPKELLDVLPEKMGLDVRKLERVVILGELASGDGTPVAPGFIFRFAAPVQGKDILGKALDGVREASFEGKSYFTAAHPKPNVPPDAGYVADDRTILIAPEPTLRKMLSAKGDGPLAGRMKRLDLKADVSAAFVMEPVRDAAKDYFKHMPIEKGLGPDFAELPTLPDRLKAGSLALNLSGATLLKVTLEADNDDSARVLEKLLGRGVSLFKQQMYPGLRKSLGKSLPPETSKSVLDVLDQVPEGISVAREGKEVTLTLKAPKGLEALGPILMQFFLAQEKPPPPGK